VELAAVVNRGVESSRPLAEQRGQALTLTLPSDTVHLHADAARLAQVFANLVNNACKYTPAGGRIAVTAEREGAEVAISVIDTGMGISADALSHVFDMFARANRSVEHAQGGGLGVGLWLVRELVEKHGGRVEAASDGPGRGSRFTVRLPVVSAVVTEPAAKTAAPGTAGALRILVVDDNADSADTLALMLTLMGHAVQTAYDGQAALDAGPAFRPDVVLMDIGLPGVNGYDAARRMRREPWGASAVLVATTGWGQEADKRRALDAGFDLHLTKPVSGDALERVLAEVSAGVRPPTG
jgi:CheY-like chemotaxis protein